jgi:predicted AlkP superfamily phosphohydrolase/phosphomutase
MVSGPPFAEEAPMVADPNGLLTGEPPSRMGGFSKIPKTAELDEFCAETLAVGDAQFEYALAQLRARRWDLFFFTSLVIDRVEHYTWRNYSAGGPGPLPQVIPRAHEALDAFLRAALELQTEGQRLVLLSDHGHGPRAEIGVNLHEYLRRRGLYQISRSSSTLKKRGIEWAKTMVYSAAPRLGAENAAIAFARRLPAKRALKSGSFVGSPRPDSVSVPDLAGSNPFGGVRVPDSVDTEKVIATLTALTHRGKPVFRWVAPKGDVLADGDPGGLYPDLLFEMDPKYGPTWNLYGPIFSPVITRKRQSGGHTRRSVFAIWPAPAEAAQAKDSMEVHRALRHLVADASGAKGDKKSP